MIKRFRSLPIRKAGWETKPGLEHAQPLAALAELKNLGAGTTAQPIAMGQEKCRLVFHERVPSDRPKRICIPRAASPIAVVIRVGRGESGIEVLGKSEAAHRNDLHSFHGVVPVGNSRCYDVLVPS